MNLDELKAKSEDHLLNLNVEVNPNLPTIESLEEVKPKSAGDVAGRSCAIAYVIGLAFGASGEQLKSDISKYSLGNWVSGREWGFLDSPSVSDETSNECSWLSESAQALAWSLDLVGLDPRSPCDDDLATKIPFRSDPKSFIESAELRPIEEIQEQVDFHYRLHWWLRQCELAGTKTDFNYGVIAERRRALDWLYGAAVEWYDVTLGT